jgi:hypothetical protein
MDLIKGFDTFHIKHIHWEKNRTTNRLAQQASGYEVTRRNFVIRQESARCHIEGEGAEGHELAEALGRGGIAPED